MALKKNIEDGRPVALYNADQQKLIGIFRTQALATKYLFGNNNKKSNVYHAIRNKGKIFNSLLKAPIAIRFASAEQISRLGSEEVLMLDESLKKFDKVLLIGFHGSRSNLYHEHVMIKFDKKY